MTTPTQGEHAQTEALNADALDRIETALMMTIEPETAEVAIALLRAPAQPAAPQGVAYAELPEPSYEESGDSENYRPASYSEYDLRDFADRTHALRASNGQAPAGAATPNERVPEAWTNLLAYVLQDDLRNRLTPRIIDIAYTAFMQSKRPNDEDGGPSDWFNDTRPMMRELISNLRKDLIEELAAAPATPTAQAAPAAGAVAGPTDAQIDACARSMLQQPWGTGSRIQDARAFAKRILSKFAAAPTPAAQANSAPSPVGGCGLVDGAAICEAAAKKWEREAKRHKRAPGSLPSQHEARDLERARLCRNLAEKIRSTKPAHVADSVLEDAARLEQIAEAIRDYHHALDMRKHGGLAESVAFNSICQTMGMNWNQGEEAARRAARKQGGKHD